MTPYWDSFGCVRSVAVRAAGDTTACRYRSSSLYFGKYCARDSCITAKIRAWQPNKPTLFDRRGIAGLREELSDMLLRVEAMFDAAAADIVLEIEDVVKGRHQVPDVFRCRPLLFVKVNNPVQHFAELFICPSENQ